jgi:hypothetical protein
MGFPMEGVPELVFDPGDGNEPVRSIRARLRRQPFRPGPTVPTCQEAYIPKRGVRSRLVD